MERAPSEKREENGVGHEGKFCHFPPRVAHHVRHTSSCLTPRGAVLLRGGGADASFWQHESSAGERRSCSSGHGGHRALFASFGVACAITLVSVVVVPLGMAELNDDAAFFFISFVEEFPALWDTSSDLYSKTNIKASI